MLSIALQLLLTGCSFQCGFFHHKAKIILFLVKNFRVLGKNFLRGEGSQIPKKFRGEGVKTEKYREGVAELKNPKGGHVVYRFKAYEILFSTVCDTSFYHVMFRRKEARRYF